MTLVAGQLFALDPVTAFLAKEGIASGPQSMILPQRPRRLSGDFPEQPTGQQYFLTDSTLLGALNRVAASYGRAIWMYTEKYSGEKRNIAILSYSVQP